MQEQNFSLAAKNEQMDVLHESIDVLNDDYDALEGELERLSELKVHKIQIDEKLNEALYELENLKSQMPKQQMAGLLEQCKDSIVDTIMGQFGLASLVLTNMDGGSVTTTHNFKKGITSSTEDQKRYDNWQENINDPGRNRHLYDKRNKEYLDQRMKASGKAFVVESEYSGKKIIYKDKDGNIIKDPITKKRLVETDHVIPVKAYETDAEMNLFMSLEERINVATDDKNLAASEVYENRAKGSKDPDEHFDFNDPQKKNEMSLRGIKEKRVKEKIKVAKDHYNSSQMKAKIKKYTKELAMTGGKDAAKMAAYSALGVILKELVEGLMIELRATFDENKKESFKEIFKRFKDRFLSIIQKIKSEWKEIFAGSFEQGLTAFLSNIVTFIINIFFTTLKRFVMIIRAGFSSLCQAIKIIANPPKDMPKEDVYFEALKVFTAGLIGAFSLLLTEIIEKFLLSIPGLNALLLFPVPVINETVGSILSTTLSAIVGGILTTVALYFMDKVRSNDKEDKLQIQIIAQGGVVVECKIAQTYYTLGEAYEYFEHSIEHSMRILNKTAKDIYISSQEIDKELDSFENTLDRLKKLQKN